MSSVRFAVFALSISTAIHVGLGLLLIGLASGENASDVSEFALESCVLIQGDETAAVSQAEGRSRITTQVSGEEEQNAESSEPFQSVVKDLAPRPDTEEGVLPGSTSTGHASTDGTFDAGETGTKNAKSVVYFGVKATGKRVVFVLDRSLSMGLNGTFQQAREELLQSLQALPTDARFQVILYNRHAEPLRVDGATDLLCAKSELIEQTSLLVRRARSEGGTDHLQAIRAALRLGPDTIFLVTDGDDLTQEIVDATARFNKSKTVIHAIEVTRWLDSRRSSPMKNLAQATGGTYRAVVVKASPE
jgi:von Willebrand factor type A domain